MYLDGFIPSEHHYTLAVIGLPRKYERSFSSRQSANEFMYKLCSKFDLHIVEVYDDKHDKTYKCDHGVRFYIHRV